MQTRSLLGLFGLAGLLTLSATVVPQSLPAQQPGSALPQTAKTGEPPLAAVRPRVQREAAVVQAQVSLLDLQKRQLDEQVKAQIRALEEQEREQTEQIMADAKRQAEQLRREANRQIEQIRLRAKWQQEQLDAQRRLVEAQAEIRPNLMRAVTPSATPGARSVPGQPGIAPPSSTETRLERILDRLERMEKRLDRLEKQR
jgi:hypothetical protein